MSSDSWLFKSFFNYLSPSLLNQQHRRLLPYFSLTNIQSYPFIKGGEGNAPLIYFQFIIIDHAPWIDYIYKITSDFPQELTNYITITEQENIIRA